ncbi:Uncharacterised protein [Mycobacteroides abscessus subsp. bolletii]|nr:Uncharacterised protein [Mycobacteroides abscessus subsp. bolletii]
MSQTLVTVNRFQACVDDTGYQVRAGAWNYQP